MKPDHTNQFAFDFSLPEVAPKYRPPSDICAKRHGGAESSREANLIAEPGKRDWHKKIVAFARTQPDFTLKEIARHYGKNLNEISGRISELKQMGVIREKGKQRRERCAVLELVK